MKKLLCLFLFSGIHFFAVANNDNKRESLPRYWIEKTEKNPKLNQDQAEFIITCNNLIYDVKRPLTGKYSINGVNGTVKINAEQRFTLAVKPGKYIFQFFVENHLEIYTDSITILPAHSTYIQLNFENVNYPVIAEKPVIYVYSPVKQNFHLDLVLSGEFLFTYPLYKNGWDFSADSNGTLTSENKTYNYLFYDAKLSCGFKSMNEGFLVKKENLLTFLEEKLSAMNFNSREQQDFITYWYPKMMKNESNFIKFLINEDYDQIAKVKMNPAPSSSLRVFMLWTNSNNLEYTEIIDQALPKANRAGLFLLEWGGSEVVFSEN